MTSSTRRAAPHNDFALFIMRVCIILLLSVGFTVKAADSFFFDKDHTEIRFYYEHGGVSEQSGEFTGFKGDLIFDEADFANNSVSLNIDSKSVNTGVRRLDGELQNPYYFSAKEHPSITFDSTEFQKIDSQNFVVIGDLTVRGITQQISLDVEIRHRGKHPLGKNLAYYRGEWLGIKAKTSFKRSDFEMTSWIPVISDLVRVEVNAELKARKKK
ncbi:MAG: YceI family protein [Pseudomonadota bacterium]